MLTRLLVPKEEASKRLTVLLGDGGDLRQQVSSGSVPLRDGERRKVLWENRCQRTLSETFEDVSALDKVIEEANERTKPKGTMTAYAQARVYNPDDPKVQAELQKEARQQFATRVTKEIHRLQEIHSLLDECEDPPVPPPVRYVAVVCEAGHVYSPHWEKSADLPHKFCHMCRARLLTECSECHHPLDSAQLPIDQQDVEGWDPPNYCPYCSEPFSWTRRRLEAVEQFLTAAKGLSKQDQDDIRKNWEFLLVQVPETPVAAYKVNQALSRMKSEVASVARKILTDVATDWVKRYTLEQLPPT